MNSIIPIVSSIAALAGLLCICPQLSCMLRARSSSGQSAGAWGLGAATNSALGFVNQAGYHATVLAAGNLLSAVGCLAALALVYRFRGQPTPEAAITAVPGSVADLRTHEFEVLHDAVLSERQRRTGNRQQLPAAQSA